MDPIPSLKLRSRSTLAATVAAGLTVVGCTKHTLTLQAGSVTQGNPRVECSLVDPWPGPAQMQLNVTVSSPCRTTPTLFIHVFTPGAEEPIATVRRQGPIELAQVGRFASGVFKAQPSGVELEVQVVTECEHPAHQPAEPIYGETLCRVP